ncbi:MAG: NADH-quinone oxidoreductase subunit NuoB [Desulfitobacteriaceae bacterium]
MLRLFKKSLKTGIVTTSYPQQPDFPAEGFRGLPTWSQERCQRCGNCAEVCPVGGIVLKRGAQDYSYWSLDPKSCLFCGYCAEDCPCGAITLSTEFELAESAQSAGRIDESAANITRIFGRSVHIRHLDAGSCNGCDWEMTTLTGPVYDVQRLGFDFVASPRHADVLMVTGPVTRNLEIAALKTYKAVPAPKLVVAVGSCACSGGICGKSYTSAGGVNHILPVDVYVPGCPPRPQALIQGLLKAVGRRNE